MSSWGVGLLLATSLFVGGEGAVLFVGSRVALEAKPVALDLGVPLGTRAHGGIPMDPDLAALGHGMAPPPPACCPGQAWPGQVN